MFESSFSTAITNNVVRAKDAFARSDDIGAAQAISQAISQAMVVTAAGIAAGLYSATVRIPLKELSIVFNSLSDNPGKWASALRWLGTPPLDSSRVQAIIKTYAADNLDGKGC